MRRRATDVLCVFLIHLARLRTEMGPFLLAGLAFPGAMYMFASGIGAGDSSGVPDMQRSMRFLAGSIVFSLSLTAISWLGYLLLENRFTGRLKLFATLPLAPSSYVWGILVFALAQSALGTASLFLIARFFGVRTSLTVPTGVAVLALVVILTVLCVCGLAVVIAARARSFSEGSLLTDALGAGLVFLAPVYCTPEAMPKVLQLIAPVLPTTHAARAVRTALSGGTNVAADLTALTFMAALLLGLGFRTMRWREE
jgi:ABC-2 type transport system permease protein